MPAAVPAVDRAGAVDAGGRVLETTLRTRRQRVTRGPVDPAGLQPALLDHARDRGADGGRRDAERSEQGDQRGDPCPTATRPQVVAVEVEEGGPGVHPSHPAWSPGRWRGYLRRSALPSPTAMRDNGHHRVARGVRSWRSRGPVCAPDMKGVRGWR